MAERIGFYRRRGDRSMQCYRAIRWPHGLGKCVRAVKTIRQLFGKHRPGAAMIELAYNDGYLDVGHIYHDALVQGPHDLDVYPGQWVVMPQDRGKPITVLEHGDFEAQYKDATLKRGE